MKSIKLLIIFVLSILPLLSFCQDGQSKGLKIGDTIPAITISKILRYKKDFLNLAEVRGKILVIDFWAPWCIPCIKALPGLSKLQRDFKDDLLILAVSTDDKPLVEHTLATLPTLKSVQLPFVYDDKILRNLFPHNVIPHDILIDQNGIVRAITQVENVNALTIRKLIQKEEINVPTKKMISFDYFVKPYFIDSLGQSLMLGYNIFTKGNAGFMGTIHLGEIKTEHRDTLEHRYNRVYGTNCNFVNMYQAVLLHNLHGATSLPQNRFQFRVKDSSKFAFMPRKFNLKQQNDYIVEHCYCFDFYSPPGFKENVFTTLKNYLDNYFNINSRLDSAEVECYIIKNLDSTKYMAKGGNSVHDFSDRWTITNTALNSLEFRLNLKSAIPIVLDNKELGMRKADLSISPYVDDFDKLRKELNRNGLELIRTKRKLRVAILEDRT